MTDESVATRGIERHFSNDCRSVWRAWVDSEMFARWYGPNVETIIHQFSMSSGGTCLIEMKVGDKAMYQRFDVVEVVSVERIEFLLSTTDAAWEVSSMMPDWPKTFLIVVELSESPDGGADMCLTSQPYQASAAEIACFRENAGSMDAGWNAGFDLIEAAISSGV